MDTMKENNRIDFQDFFNQVWALRMTFFKVWALVFVLSAVWIFSLPRYYRCEVKLAPENSSKSGSSLAGLASSFGINLGDKDNSDAISPTLYPELFTSPEFLVDVLGIEVTTDDARVTTDYYAYLKYHQKHGWIVQPILDLIDGFSAPTDTIHAADLNPFYLSRKDYQLIKNLLPQKLKCNISKKNDVITISVEDQDKLVSATLADSIRVRLQAHIIEYRTVKTRQDMMYYKHLADSAQVEYELAIEAYGNFLDRNKHVALKTTVEKGKQLSNDLDTKLRQYNLLNTQYMSMRAKVQEATPAFTLLTSASVPQKPAGPKRLFFVLGMLILSTMVVVVWKMHRELREWF